MLTSTTISRRQSEIRQHLAELAAKSDPNEDETRSMDSLDREYRQNETRFRAALIAEDTERREATDELADRGGREWSDLIAGFELRQIALALDEGRTLSGRTAEVVSELRERGGYRGVPIPYEALALETRANETVASGVPNPMRTAPIIDRIFAESAAGRMGASFINVDSGEHEYPVATAGAQVAWQSSETGSVGANQIYATVDRPLTPDHTLGCQMAITRRSLKQSGAALEAAIRRDMSGAIGAAMDSAVFLGSGSSGQPTGIIAGAAGWGITSTAIAAAASWGAFRAAVTRFLTANAANGPGAVKLLIRPEVWADLDETLVSGTAVSQWDLLVKNIPAGNIVMSAGALAAPTGSPAASSAILTTTVAGVPPIYVGTWGGIDVIRDPFSGAASGELRLTALATIDVTVSRPVQIELLTGIQ